MEEDLNIFSQLIFFPVWKSVGPCESTPSGKGFVTEKLSYEGNSTILEERESECNVDPVEGNAETVSSKRLVEMENIDTLLIPK